jgi:hypothetical protein
MIDRAIKRLIQTKAIKQMLGQTSPSKRGTKANHRGDDRSAESRICGQHSHKQGIKMNFDCDRPKNVRALN